MSAERPMERPKNRQSEGPQRQVSLDRKPRIDIGPLGGKPLSKVDLTKVNSGRADIISLEKYQQVAYPPKPYQELEDAYFFGDLAEFQISEEKAAAIRAVAEDYFGMELYHLPTEGNLNMVSMNAPTKEDATELVKIGSSLTSRMDALKYQLKYDLYATLYPEHFPPLETFYIEPEESGFDEPVSGVRVQKVEAHPLYQQALSQAQRGDSALLKNITTHPFDEVLEECHRHNVPLNFDLAARNIIPDEKGYAQIIDDIWTEGEEIIGFELNVYNLLSERATTIEEKHTALLKEGASLGDIKESQERREANRRDRRKVWQIIRAIERVNDVPKKNRRETSRKDFREAA